MAMIESRTLDVQRQQSSSASKFVLRMRNLRANPVAGVQRIRQRQISILFDF